MNADRQVERLVIKLKNITNGIKKKEIGIESLESVREASKTVNQYFYHSDILNFQSGSDLETLSNSALIIEEMERLIEIWKVSIKRRRKNKVDAEFWELYEYFTYVGKEMIYQTVVNHFLSLTEEVRASYLVLQMHYPFLKNTIDYKKEDYSLIEECVELVYNRIDEIKWLYEHLGDYRSKAILNGIIRYWFDFDLEHLHSLRETIFPDYYDLDILTAGEEAVVVDVGAYVGDSLYSFVDMYKVYKRIYAYEITPSTFLRLQENVAEYPNVVLLNKGVANTSGTMYVEGEELGIGNKLKNNGDVEVEVVTLDEDIKESISIIKMDIEGAEKDAILGAKRHIKEEKPKLLISLYHLQDDIIDIPKLINNIRDDYKFYIRYNGRNEIWPRDYILLAV